MVDKERLVELAERKPDDLIGRLCELHRRVLSCWQSPTGEAPPRRGRAMTPEFNDASTIIFATVELERQAHDLKELRDAIAFIRPALPVLRNLLGTIGLRLGETKAEEMIAAVDALDAAALRSLSTPSMKDEDDD
jgi:hypothetical protein